MSESPARCLTPLAKVDGWPITLATPGDTVDAIVNAAIAGQSFSVTTLNLDHLVKLRRNPQFRSSYRQAKFVTADGAPVAWLARRACRGIERTTGADLVLPLAKAAADAELPVFLFGTTTGVLARAGTYLAAHTQNAIDIVGTVAPPQGFDPVGPEADDCLDIIANSGAKLCFLALGAPKQEILAARAVERGIKVGFVSVGAALDFLAGTQVRAPKFLQNHGLEWSWRLATNPGRLAPRYMSCAVVFADILMREFTGLARRAAPDHTPA